MTNPARPLDLRALATGHVCVHVAAKDDAGALAALAAVEGVLGPAPWAFVLEPDAPGEPFEVRVEVPDPVLAPGLAAVEGAWFEVADPAGLVEAVDRGWLVEEREVLDGVRVSRLLVGDEARQPDLHRSSGTDAELVRLEGVLAAAAAPFPLIAEEQAAGLVPVVHRPTGRPGVEVWIGGDPLPERRRVLAALAAAVAREPLLVPALDFDEVLGALVVRAWLAVPPAPGLPADADLATEPDDPRWLADRVGHCAELELQVLPATNADHDAVVDRVTALAEACGLTGGPPRWLQVDGRRRFAPTWVGELPDAEALATLRGLPGVARVRVVPGMPFGLEVSWPVSEPAWRMEGGVLWQRIHDPVPDRDRLEEVVERPADERDHAAAGPIAADVRPILDSTGRRGLEVRGGAGTLGVVGLHATLADAAVSHPELSWIGTFGFERSGVVARRWWRDGVDPGPRRWAVAR